MCGTRGRWVKQGAFSVHSISDFGLYRKAQAGNSMNKIANSYSCMNILIGPLIAVMFFFMTSPLLGQNNSTQYIWSKKRRMWVANIWYIVIHLRDHTQWYSADPRNSYNYFFWRKKYHFDSPVTYLLQILLATFMGNCKVRMSNEIHLTNNLTSEECICHTFTNGFNATSYQLCQAPWSSDFPQYS